MPRRGGAVHVATVRTRYKDRSYVSHLLRRSYREGGKVKHETLGNLSHLPEPVIELVRQALAGEELVRARRFRSSARSRTGTRRLYWARSAHSGSSVCSAASARASATSASR